MAKAPHDVQDKTATQELNKTSKQAKGNEVHGNESRNAINDAFN